MHFSSKDTCKMKVRGWKKIFHANGNQKKAGVAILISDKIGFKDCYKRQSHYVMTKRSIQDTKIVNVCALNTLQYIRQLPTAIKGEIGSNIIIAGDFNTALTSVNRLSRQKINKETQALNDASDQRDLTDVKNIPSKSSRIHILLKNTWNIL